MAFWRVTVSMARRYGEGMATVPAHIYPGADSTEASKRATDVAQELYPNWLVTAVEMERIKNA